MSTDPQTTGFRMFTAWLRYAVTQYLCEFRRRPPDQRLALLGEDGPLTAEIISEMFVNGSAELVTNDLTGDSRNEAADLIARGMALLLLHQRDVLRAERAAGKNTSEDLATVHLFGRDWNADVLIRERCDRLAEEDDRWCALRAAGYVEPDWDALADSYVDGSHTEVARSIRNGLRHPAQRSLFEAA